MIIWLFGPLCVQKESNLIFKYIYLHIFTLSGRYTLFKD